MVNLPTKLRPAWKNVLKLFGLAYRKMPQDVATKWNSMYLMIKFALEYCEAIDKMTNKRSLRECEMDDDEWALVEQLCQILQVNHSHTLSWIHMASLSSRHFVFVVSHHRYPPRSSPTLHSSSLAMRRLTYPPSFP